MGKRKKERVQTSGEPCQGGYCSCGCNETAMESRDIPEDMMASYITKSKPLDTQIGGEHYKTLAIQPITYIMTNDLGWCEGNAIKYITRFKQKGGRQDIEKAVHYLQILLDSLD